MIFLFIPMKWKNLLSTSSNIPKGVGYYLKLLIHYTMLQKWKFSQKNKLMDIGQDIAVENNELFCLFLSWFSNLRLILVFEPVCVIWHSKIAHFLDFLRPLCGGALALIHFLRSMDKWGLESRALSNSCDEKKYFWL